MTQRRSHRKPHAESTTERATVKSRRESTKHPSNRWNEPRSANRENTAFSDLANLIEQDAPLKTHNGLVLMYGPFQAEMLPEHGQGVASWLRECVRKHGLPSLVRFDYRHRAQVFRRDQFQSWLEPLLAKIPG
jgi:hypothetical protein